MPEQAGQRRRAVVVGGRPWRGRNHATEGIDAVARDFALLLRRFVAERVSAVTRRRLASAHARRQPPTARRLRPRGAPGGGPRRALHAGSGSAARRLMSPAAAAPSSGSGTVRLEPPKATVALVHVAGAVRSPGVYRLRDGERVQDAVRRAGGARAGADLNAINLAAKVADGQQVVVPRRGAAGAAPVDAASGLRRGRRPAAGAGQPQQRDGRAARHARRRRPGHRAARSSSTAGSTAAFARSTTSARSRASARSAWPR